MKKSKFLPTILGVAALASSVALPYNTFADSKTAEVKITVAESLSLTLSDNAINFDLSDAAFHSDSLTVTGATNSAGGYTISFGTNNDYNDLRHSNILVEDKIESVTEDKTEANFPATAWGVSTDAETFKQVPIAAANIFSTDTKGENDHTFTIGAKAAADMAAGDYSNELMFTIVANPEPILTISDITDMQQMTSGICAASTENESKQLIDVRDNKSYWVTKLADGNCWMTQNLDYDLSVTANQTLTPETSNVAETRIVIPSNADLATFSSEDADNIHYLDGGNYYYVSGITKTEGYSNLSADSVDRHYAQGDYYSWKAATAGVGTTSIIDTDVDESICPSNWRLPAADSYTDNYSFGKLTNAYGITNYSDGSYSDERLLSSPLFFVRGGYVFSGELSALDTYGEGNYWSSKASLHADYAYTLSFDYGTGGIHVDDFRNRSSGFNIRCVAK